MSRGAGRGVAAGASSQSDRLLDDVRRRILRAEIRPGDLLAEPELAAEYGVSRTPARETLRSLAAEGWLAVLPRKGYLVRPLSGAEVRDVMELRLILEPALAADAARHATRELIDGLRELAGVGAGEDGGADGRSDGCADRAGADDPGADGQVESADELAARLDRAATFHLRIAEASGNRRAAIVLRGLVDEVNRLHHLVPRVGEHVRSDAERAAHAAIIAAIAARDADEAARCMREHLREARDAMFAAF